MHSAVAPDRAGLRRGVGVCATNAVIYHNQKIAYGPRHPDVVTNAFEDWAVPVVGAGAESGRVSQALTLVPAGGERPRGVGTAAGCRLPRSILLTYVLSHFASFIQPTSPLKNLSADREPSIRFPQDLGSRHRVLLAPVVQIAPHHSHRQHGPPQVVRRTQAALLPKILQDPDLDVAEQRLRRQLRRLPVAVARRLPDGPRPDPDGPARASGSSLRL